MGATRGNHWISLLGSVLKASPELRQGSRGTSCVASGGRGTADETGGLQRILRGTGLKTSRAENVLQQQKRSRPGRTAHCHSQAHCLRTALSGGHRVPDRSTSVDGHQTEPPTDGRRTRAREGPTHSISAEPSERDQDRAVRGSVSDSSVPCVFQTRGGITYAPDTPLA